MNAPGTAAPNYAYALAFALGLLPPPYMYGLAQMLDRVEGADIHALMWVLFWAAFAVVHAALGLAFGLLWPGRTWRWGVWLCGAPLCAVSFFNPGAAFYAGWVMVSLLPSCACAYAAGSYGLRQTAGNYLSG